jgi:ubiquinone/menaquinone biosynthesis C-methylase UbiE
MSKMIEDSEYKIYGIDKSSFRLKLARERSKDDDNIRFYYGDIFALPFKDSKFSVVYLDTADIIFGNSTLVS